ncbi:WxcM-like domain-containing protein [Pseudopedobacter saltans DSM 12145]|uniref:WxcM-like domain-containing protein n=1 Tax=Pseudopedobacter saltans (strain ATCC 51119 / DSM 12145 / JCM 21818 / CCUG 39354 / LMG 10337 / NBRC 100064 / NCIMB 13643) TaxID=762903 RepID=F0S7U1_PSESL|nr:FdtA/QdtA family cupin domain-containing protein [Pseudopedobacter saltans]ADY53346.1 WxcM-like domain-containing protein [Pseudopedobacter saltans DSM 12145]
MYEKPVVISLPKILDDRGNLSFVETLTHVPFDIKRTYWIYDVPGGEIRGGHSYKENQELIIALSGSFAVVVNDGFHTEEFLLNRSYSGLYIPKGIWRHMENFSTNAFALILSSTEYDEKDYERDIDQFLLSKNEIIHI